MTRTADEAGAVAIPPRKYVPKYTDTEKIAEVVRLVARGYTNAMIARKIHISEHGVKSRIRAMLDRLNAIDRAHAVHIAHGRGILRVDDHDARELRRQLAERHASGCALLTPAVCDCKAEL